jgi:hypothetical protein
MKETVDAIMPILGIMIPILSIVLPIGVVFWAIYWYYRYKRLQYEGRRLMIERGMMPEETPVTPEASLRRGAMTLCVGIGLGIGAVFLRYWGDNDAPPAWLLGVVAAIVALVGVGYLLFYFLARDRMTGQAQPPSARP